MPRNAAPRTKALRSGIDLPDRAVVLVFAVGSATSGSIQLLTKTIPAVLAAVIQVPGVSQAFGKRRFFHPRPFQVLQPAMYFFNTEAPTVYFGSTILPRRMRPAWVRNK